MRRHFQRAIRNRTDRLPQRRVSLCIRAALLGAVVPMFAAGAASAATITVNSLADGAPTVDGACTLREAITNANDNADVSGGDCAAGSGVDTIAFSSPGTITLGSELPILTDTERTTIDGDIGGNGRINVTVSGNNAVRVFHVGSGAAATLSWLNIADGNTVEGGGGVWNEGDLTLTHSTVSGNAAAFQGGGVFNDDYASLHIDHSMIADNDGGLYGGAVEHVGAALVIVNSTFFGNHASYYGGGIDAFSGTLAISHSTLAGNSTDGQGGGIYLNSTGTLDHSIIAGNTASNCAFGGSGVLSATGGNLQFGDASCGAVVPVGDPLLGPLQDNGGSTGTMLPGTGSAAVDAATCDPAVTDDQRGVARPQGFSCDIGAVEVIRDVIFANGFE